MQSFLLSRYQLRRACVKVKGMGHETYKKRQKELARQQKQRDKAARREERKGEKKRGEPTLTGENPVAAGSHATLRAQTH